jgi:hypothetical protein
MDLKVVISIYNNEIKVKLFNNKFVKKKFQEFAAEDRVVCTAVH